MEKYATFYDMPGFDTFVKIEPINKGWSNDKKYYIETTEREKRLLRIAEQSEYKRKKNEFKTMKRIAALGIRMSQPLAMGTCNGGKQVYTLLSWCEGEDAKTVLPTLPESEQYEIGLKAGEILRRIHSLDSVAKDLKWSKARGERIDGYIESYKNCGMTFDGDTLLIRYVQEHRHLLRCRPSCLTHGDFHVGNLVLSPEKELYVIDFQRCGVSDPYAAFGSIMFSADVSAQFATGQVHGYFGGEPPAEFWELLSFYLAAANIHALPWSLRFGQEEIDFAYHMIGNILCWFDSMKNSVPTWYLK